MSNLMLGKLTFKAVILPCGERGSNKLYTTNLFTRGMPSCMSLLLKQLTQRGLHITLKADALFPDIDDTDETISRL